MHLSITERPTSVQVFDSVFGFAAFGFTANIINSSLSTVFQDSTVFSNTKAGLSNINSSLSLSLENSSLYSNKIGAQFFVPNVLLNVNNCTIANDGLHLQTYLEAEVIIMNTLFTHCSVAALALLPNRAQSNTTANITNSHVVKSLDYSVLFFTLGDDNMLSMNVQNCSFSENIGRAVFVQVLQLLFSVCLIVTITDCVFDRNRAESLIVEDVNSGERSIIKVSVSSCSFQDNSGSSVVSLNLVCLDEAGSAIFHMVSFTNNRVLSSGLSIMSLGGFSNTTIVDCVFVNNSGTPISQVRGTLFVSGTNILKNNAGFQGGGISLFDSQIVINSSNTSVIFDGNYASAVGGAFFIVKSVYTSSKAGFYDIDVERPSNNEMVLRNNDSAPVCHSLDHILVPCHAVYPGELFNLSAVVVGDEFGTLSSTVYAGFLTGGPEVQLGPQQDSQTVKFEECNNLTYSLHSIQTEPVTLVLKVDRTTTSFYGSEKDLLLALDNYHAYGLISVILLTTPVYLNFTLLDCPLGFEIAGDPPSCDCTAFLKSYNISSCSFESHKGLLYCTGTEWVGTINNKTQVLVSGHCPFGYCDPATTPVAFDEADNQCINGHSGRLCGGCMNNFSLSLGSSECRECTNDGYLALLLVFALAGVLLVFFVKMLDLTVAVGTINGLLFYANIVWANQSVIFSSKEGSVFGGILQVFLAWINLDFGISTCFFVGMNSVWKTSLQIVFPLYIWALAGLVILVSKYSIKASRFFGNNSVPLLATLFILSYSKILRFIIKILSFTYIYHPDGYAMVWTEDGTIPYLSPAHSALFAVALFCLLFLWAPFMLTLLFIQPLRKFDHYWPFRWINKWKPLFDSYTGPLKDKHHYWVGVLLLARGVILVTSAITSSTLPRVNLLTIAIFVRAISGVHSKYNKWPMSVLEKSFFFNLLLLSCSLLYIDIVRDTVPKRAISYTSATIVFLQFIGIVFGHFVYRIKDWRSQRKLQAEGRVLVRVSDDESKDFREPLLGWQ